MHRLWGELLVRKLQPNPELLLVGLGPLVACGPGRVGQRVAIEMATEGSATTRLKDSPENFSLSPACCFSACGLIAAIFFPTSSICSSCESIMLTKTAAPHDLGF